MSTLEEYTDTDAGQHRSAKHTIARILERCRGRDAAVSSSDLAEAVDPAATTVRDLIPEIRREECLPIVACSAGYYVIDDAEDFEHHVGRIDDEIDTRMQTKRDLARAWNRERGVVGCE